MDTLILKRHFIDQPVPMGDVNKTDMQPQISFIEFFINDRPLSTLLDEFYASKHINTLKNNIGVLGSFGNLPIEIIKVKQLLGKRCIPEDFEEVRELLTRTIDKDRVNDIIDTIKDELSEPGTMVYCCAQCGDYLCGGVNVNILIDENYVKWAFGEEAEILEFVFNKYAYLETMKAYLNKIKMSLSKQ